MRVFDSFGQFARGARGVLVHRIVGRFCIDLKIFWVLIECSQKRVVGQQGASLKLCRNDVDFFCVGEEQARPAVCDSEGQTIGSKKCEQRDCDSAGLHDAEQTGVKSE